MDYPKLIVLNQKEEYISIHRVKVIHIKYLLLSVCLCTLVAYIANSMDQDQTAPIGAVWSRFILFASHDKSSLEWIIRKYSADMISRYFSGQKKFWQDKG